MINPILLTASLMALVIAQSAIAQDEDDTLVLQPSSDWQLREMDDRCRLSRRFGEGENRTTFWLDQGGAEPFYNLTMVGHPFRHLYGQYTQVRFGPAEPPSVRGYISASSSSGRPVMMLHGIEIGPRERDPENEFQPAESVSAERLDAIKWIEINRAVMDPVRLQTGTMNEPLDHLQTCATVLGAKLTLAGMATSDKARGATPIDHDQWSKHIRYPDYLLRSGVVGDIRIRLTVNSLGKAVNCQIIGSTSSQVFDNEVCLALMRNARFSPALDAEGQPTTSYYIQEVRFSIR